MPVSILIPATTVTLSDEQCRAIVAAAGGAPTAPTPTTPGPTPVPTPPPTPPPPPGGGTIGDVGSIGTNPGDGKGAYPVAALTATDKVYLAAVSLSHGDVHVAVLSGTANDLNNAKNWGMGNGGYSYNWRTYTGPLKPSVDAYLRARGVVI